MCESYKQSSVDDARVTLQLYRTSDRRTNDDIVEGAGKLGRSKLGLGKVGYGKVGR